MNFDKALRSIATQPLDSRSSGQIVSDLKNILQMTQNSPAMKELSESLQLNTSNFKLLPDKKKMELMHHWEIKKRLYSREGGASLINERGPYFMQQMRQDKITRSNMNHKLRLNSIGHTVQSKLPGSLQPKNASYMLDRMNANERFYKKFKLKQHLKNFFSP